MTWFRVDDKLHGHRKARAVRRSDETKARDAAPFGLWVLAGSWCGDNDTKGFVPLEILEGWDDDAETLAERLVDAGLWCPDEQNGEPGYAFKDWHVQNPSGASEFANHVRWHANRGIVEPSCSHCPTEPADLDDPMNSPTGIRPESVGISDRTPTGIGSESGADIPTPPLTRPDPTRPVPEPEKNLSPIRARKETDALPAGFVDWWDAYDHKVGRKKAISAYRSALRKPGVDPGLLLHAATAYVESVKADGKHPQWTKHPTTWLNGEHWRDERPERPASAPPQSRVQQHLALARQLADEQAPIPFPQIGGSR